MRNKKGFTLIELLAIIVILAVIMVIAVPQILDVVNGSKNSAWKDNVGMIKKAIVTNSQLFDPETGVQKYSIGNLCSNTSKLSEIVKLEDTNVSCSGNVFKLTGTGQFEGKSATISCTGSKCNINISSDAVLTDAGLYDGNNRLLASWDELVNTYGMNLNWAESAGDGVYYYVDGAQIELENLLGYENDEPHVEGWHKTTDKQNIYDINSIESVQPAIVLGKLIGDKQNTKLVLPNTIDTLPLGAFLGINAAEVIISDSVTEIGSAAFQLASTRKVIIPDSVTTIGEYAFALSKIEEITLSNSITEIPAYMLFMDINLKQINIPEGVISIGNDAFNGALGLKTITLPSTLTTLGELAIAKTGIREIHIPSSVTTFGKNSVNGVLLTYYNGTAELTTDILGYTGSLNPTVYCEGDFCYTDNTKKTLYAYLGTDASVTIPSSVETIRRYCFMNDIYIRNVTIPTSVKKIDIIAFATALGLQEATFKNTNGWIGKRVDNDTVVFSSADLSNSVTAATYLKTTHYDREWTRSE